MGYYRAYVKDYSQISRPLTQLLQKGVPFIWGEEQQTAYI